MVGSYILSLCSLFSLYKDRFDNFFYFFSITSPPFLLLSLSIFLSPSPFFFLFLSTSISFYLFFSLSFSSSFEPVVKRFICEEAILGNLMISYDWLLVGKIDRHVMLLLRLIFWSLFRPSGDKTCLLLVPLRVWVKEKKSFLTRKTEKLGTEPPA